MLQLVLFSCPVEPASSSALPPVWLELDYVDCKKVVLPQVTETLPWKPAHTANPTAFLLPPVLPWSPQEAYNCPLMCPVCTNGQRTSLVADAWGVLQCYCVWHGSHFGKPFKIVQKVDQHVCSRYATLQASSAVYGKFTPIT